MFYRLTAQYALRGWQKMSCVLMHISGKTKELSPEEFQLLMLCDGSTVMDEFITPSTQKCLEHFVHEGIIEACDIEKPITSGQMYRYFDNRYVQSVAWSLTGHCNFRCRHCYMDAPHELLGEISHEDALHIIDQIAECGIYQVILTGGEPFVRKDFWQLVDYMLSKRISVIQVYTNAWLLNEHTLEQFKARGLCPSFSISFDGVGWHDWMRGIPGAEKQTIRALKLCKEKGFPTSVEMCVHKGNQHTIRETVKLLASLGVRSLKFASVQNTDLWKQNSEGNAIDIREYYDTMIEYIPHFYEDGMPMNIILGGIAVLQKNSLNYQVVAERYDGTVACENCYLCNTVRYSSYITPDARLLPCLSMTAYSAQEEFPLIRDIGLQKGLSDSFYMQFVSKRVKDLLAANEECNTCEFKYKCGGGCRASALSSGNSDLMCTDERQCILWKEHYVEKIHKVADTAIAKFCKSKGDDGNNAL